MLINVKHIKLRIKSEGFRSNSETIMAIDRKVNTMLNKIFAEYKGRTATLRQIDIEQAKV